MGADHRKGGIAIETVFTAQTLHGRVTAPVSKSEAHRALIAAALSGLYRAEEPDDGTIIRVACAGRSHSMPAAAEEAEMTAEDIAADDIRATLRCLRALGVRIGSDAGGFLVRPLRASGLPRRAVLDCGASASTLRFLLPAACALCGLPGAPERMEITFEGRERLPLRTISPLEDVLTAHGAKVSVRTTAGTHLPLCVSGGLFPGAFPIDGSLSSQFVSGLLFALPLLGEASTLTVTGHTASAPYIGMTIDTLRRVGCVITGTMPCFTVGCAADRKDGLPQPMTLPVGGDWSAGAVLLALGLLSPGGSVCVEGLDPAGMQGDRMILDILRQMGGRIDAETDPNGQPCFRAYPSPLRGISVNASDVPDLVPVIAACAAVAQGDTVITGAGRLRDKESDRLSALSELLNTLGGQVTVTEDGLLIRGVPRLTGGSVAAHGDHRMVFCAALAAEAARAPVTVTGAEAVAKSYPAFPDDLDSLTQA